MGVPERQRARGEMEEKRRRKEKKKEKKRKRKRKPQPATSLYNKVQLHISVLCVPLVRALCQAVKLLQHLLVGLLCSEAHGWVLGGCCEGVEGITLSSSARFLGGRGQEVLCVRTGSSAREKGSRGRDGFACPRYHFYRRHWQLGLILDRKEGRGFMEKPCHFLYGPTGVERRELIQWIKEKEKRNKKKKKKKKKKRKKERCLTTEWSRLHLGESGPGSPW